jgi:hypothetical protein
LPDGTYAFNQTGTALLPAGWVLGTATDEGEFVTPDFTITKAGPYKFEAEVQ